MRCVLARDCAPGLARAELGGAVRVAPLPGRVVRLWGEGVFLQDPPLQGSSAPALSSLGRRHEKGLPVPPPPPGLPVSCALHGYNQNPPSTLHFGNEC